jgi:hypothetical protein
VNVHRLCRALSADSTEQRQALLADLEQHRRAVMDMPDATDGASMQADGPAPAQLVVRSTAPQCSLLLLSAVYCSSVQSSAVQCSLVSLSADIVHDAALCWSGGCTGQPAFESDLLCRRHLEVQIQREQQS